MSQRGHNLSLPSVPVNLFMTVIYLILYLQCLAPSLTYGMDVDAYLIDEWKFDTSFLRGPGICFRLECQVTQESSVHHPEHCRLHKQCLPTSPSLMPWSPASLVSECSLSLSLSPSSDLWASFSSPWSPLNPKALSAGAGLIETRWKTCSRRMWEIAIPCSLRHTCFVLFFVF